MKKIALVLMAAAAALVLTVGTAAASVSFDSSTGTGWVGKGDVQLAFAWNNQAAQKYAKEVAFNYDGNDVYDVECYWETETGNGSTVVHDITVPRHTSINASIAYDARLKNQYTGYNLLGFGTTVHTGSVPAIGDPCPGNSNNGTVINVTQTGSTGGLSVTWNGTTVALPNTPVV